MPRTKPVFEKVERKVPKGTKKSVKPPKAKKNKTKTKAELAAEKKAIAEWDIYFVSSQPLARSVALGY